MAQVIREPFPLLSRRLASPPRQSSARMIAPNSPTKRQHTTAPGIRSSKLITALDALTLNSAIEVKELDEDIEIVRARHIPESSGGDGKSSKLKPVMAKEPTVKHIHPFFYPSATKESLRDDTRPAPTKTKCDIITSKTIGRAFGRSKASVLSSGAKPPPAVLPTYSYKDYAEHRPVVVFTKVEDEANELVNGVKAGPVALDMEWRVMFMRRRNSPSAQTVERRVAVVQVADTRGVILVVQVYGMARFPKNLQSLIENPEVPKIGVNILNDGKKLFRDYGILAKNLVELGAVALVADPDTRFGKTKRKIVSLVKLVEKYCGKILVKSPERTGNWEAELTHEQLEYAANDAHSTLIVYQRLSEIMAQRGLMLKDSAPEYTSHVEFDPRKAASNSVSRTSSLATTTGTKCSQETDYVLEFLEESGIADTPVPVMRPQYLRAYRYWHERGLSMEQMCIELSLKGEGLKASTVISYVIGALQADSTLPFEMWKLRELVQMDGTSWSRHREWMLSAWTEGKGLPVEGVNVENKM